MPSRTKAINVAVPNKTIVVVVPHDQLDKLAHPNRAVVKIVAVKYTLEKLQAL